MVLSREREPDELPVVSVRCRLFARYAEVVGVHDLTLDLPRGATVADAVACVRNRVHNGHLIPVRPLAAVNHAHVLPDHVLAEGDELALLPPLAGG